MEKQSCAYLEDCSMFKLFSMQSSAKIFIQNYCKSDYSECARKKLNNNEKEVPEDLLPSGERLVIK